ncbi:MAG: aminotransferase class III-fold pyridoxal phosphate-dependent enzyme, partial [Longimicrobiales bacterium]|nr:aminotransferase class III-fold pyridoxal phosphate-dependent enzyme [Longimicrobiales bacterium]
GLFLAMDLPDGQIRGMVGRACWDRGLAVLNCGANSVRFRPPLVFTRDDVAQTLRILREVLGLFNRPES